MRPLLGIDGCRFIVTSRNRFHVEGMKEFSIRPLDPDVAAGFLRTLAPRVGDRAGEVARACGYLPLALRVVGATLQIESSLPVEEYLGRLRGVRTRLAALKRHDDRDLDVEANLQLSYDLLPNDTLRQAFRALGVFPASFDL